MRGGGDAVCGVRATRVIAPRKNARRGVVMSSMDELDAEAAAVMEQIRQLQEANEKLKTDMDLFAMPEPLPERPEGAPEPGSTQGTSAPKSSFSADVLGMEMPYLGEGETRVGFQHFDKVENEKARVEAMQVEQAARVTGVTPRPPPKYEKTEWPLSIVFVSSEVTPWSKTGGLADVCGSQIGRAHV